MVEKTEPRRVPWDILDAVAIICLDIGVLGVIGLLRRRLSPSAPVAVALALMRPAVVLPLALLFARKRLGARAEELGFRRPGPGSFRWFLKFSALVGAGYVVLGLLLLLVFRGRIAPSAIRGYSEGTRRYVHDMGGWLGFGFFSLLAAPATEELVFRGVFYPAMREKLGLAWAVAASAVVFAGMHIVWRGELFLPISQLLGGLVFVWAYERTRSLLFPAVYHFVGNAGDLTALVVLTYRPEWVVKLLATSAAS